MKAIIFSAGLGTRFKPWTDEHPKALAVINGKTLLQRNIEYLQLYGITDVVVNVHHFAEQIIDAVQENKGWGSSITISDETEVVLETGGGLMHAEQFLKDTEPFLSLNVDVLTDFNINKLVDTYKNENSFIAFGVSNRKSSRNILLDDNMQMCGWMNNNTQEIKKVRSVTVYNPFAYSCITLYSQDVFKAIKQQGKFSIMQSFLELAPLHKITGLLHEGDKWIDVGKPEAVELAEKMFSE